MSWLVTVGDGARRAFFHFTDKKLAVASIKATWPKAQRISTEDSVIAYDQDGDLLASARRHESVLIDRVINLKEGVRGSSGA
ncbi:MAG: hypothetical protein KGO96_10205 [Elusimicrobia bacterium]|nr:hypothetical protein [Elusimicrobiota bacterium]